MSGIQSGRFDGQRPATGQRPARTLGRYSHARNLRKSPRGIILLEVLFAIAILLFGLLSVAILVVVGSKSLKEVERMDRTGVCGRAALHDVRIRGLLDTSLWCNSSGTTASLTSPFVAVLDPLGIHATNPAYDTMGNTGLVNRYTLQSIYSLSTSALKLSTAQGMFLSHDDLVFVNPEDNSSNVAPAGTRPRLFVQDSSATPLTGAYPTLGSETSLTTPVTPQYFGNTSWFLTVGSTADPNTFTVSVVVCYNRTIGLTNGTTNISETPYSVITPFVNNIQYGSGTISLSGDVEIGKGTWIMLCSSSQATWYRVVHAGYNGTNTLLQLAGPDWLGGTTSVYAIVVDGVSGVYTATMTKN